MKFIYLPKPRERSFLFSREKRFTGIYNRRHNKPKDVLRLVYMIIGLYLLWFAVSLGPLIPLVLGDSSAMNGAIGYAEGITLPQSTNREETRLSRLAVYIVIDKNGKTEVEGKALPETETVELFKEFLYWQPKAFPVIIADKETPMEFVTQMIHYVKEAGFDRIKFSTSQETISQAGT